MTRHPRQLERTSRPADDTRGRPAPGVPRRLLSLALLTLPLGACANACARPAPESLAPAATSAPPPAPQPVPASAVELEFADALRARRYEQAAALIDAERPDERARPEVRYARAVVALELGDTSTALRSLDHLDELYPPLAGEVRLLRETAIRQSHDLTLLEAFFGASELPDDLLAMAEAAEFQGHVGEALQRARRALTKLSSVPKERRDAVALAAHALTARLARRADARALAITEYTWLAVEVPLAEESSSADDELLALGGTLTREQRLARAEAFAAKGWVARTERELERAAKTPGAPLPPARVTGLVAHANYASRADYDAAARGFALAAKSPSDAQREYEFYEARALSRAQRDGEALAKYRALAPRGGSYGEQAAFQIGRLSLLEGDCPGAVAAFENYARTYPRGRFLKAARSELPVARFCAGQFARAERELRALFDAEKDDLERARLLELAGAAAQSAGQAERAAADQRRVIELRPLSYPALLAAARLRSLGQPEPPPLLPALPTPALAPLSVELPDEVHRLRR
ncbi:MAG TPA: hypothetical protein VLC09_20390, partial [Polyangiaceae bacterium]|nr:hypothetical protein [Polyangiaceae bacterium]